MTVEAAEEEPQDKLIGEILANRYQIEVKLGEGAMGAVYRAKHVKVGRAFAVKILHARLLEDNKVSLRFEREAELAGRLRHANVIGVVDVGETSTGLRYMVMDFAQGDDLASMLEQAPMPAPRIIHLTRQLLDGLYHAHEQGLIHRDFKPENVIVETDMNGAEVPRIVDFGIAILREGGNAPNSQGRLTTNGLVLGTPHYMAPEQAVADPIDHRIDLFALGIVVYEMLCGKLPFDGTGAEVARANLLLDPPTIAQRVPHLEVDPLLEAFARRMMAKKREHRPPTAKAARELLDLIDKDRPAAAAALGVPLNLGVRTATVTQDQTPVPRHPYAGNDTFPPPIRAEAAAPSATTIPKAQREVSTAVTGPLTFDDEVPRSGSRRWLLGGLAVLLVGGIATFALTRGDGESDAPAAQPEDGKVVMATTPPSEPPPEPVAKEPPVEVKQPEVKVQPVEVKQPEVKRPPGIAKQPLKKDPKDQKIVPPGTGSNTTVAKTPEVKQPEVQQPEPTATKSDAAAIAARYSSVGQKLKALGPAATDLWPRYRLIRIQDVMASPEKRAEASTILGKLERDIAALPK